MRLLLTLSCPQLVPFNHLAILKAAFHRWTRFAPHLHGASLSLYSLSWLQGGHLDRHKRGLRFPDGAQWAITAPDAQLIRDVLQAVLEAPEIGAFDLSVRETMLCGVPAYADGEQRFEVLSPVLVRAFTPPGTPGREQPQLGFEDPQTDQVLTHVLRRKLTAAGLDATGAAVCFDQEAPGARVKMFQYGQTRNLASDCPVFVRGTTQQLGFAWCVGVGHGSGIGCGALR